MDAETPAQPQQTAQPVQPAQPVRPSQPAQTSQPARPAQQAHPAQQAQPHGLPFGMTQEDLEEKVNNLIAITGADRDQAIAALKAAFFDVNTAANFVFEGIPASAMGGGGGGARAPAGGAGAGAGAGAGGDYDPAEAGEGIDISEQALQELEQLTTSPAFIQIRQQIQANPQILPQILPQLMQQLRTIAPNVAQEIQQNPDLLILLLTGQPGELGAGAGVGAGAGAGGAGGSPQGGRGGQGGRRGNVIELTQDEMDAIQRVIPFLRSSKDLVLIETLLHRPTSPATRMRNLLPTCCSKMLETGEVP